VSDSPEDHIYGKLESVLWGNEDLRELKGMIFFAVNEVVLKVAYLYEYGVCCFN
jgi:hypothetical protein